MATLDVDALAHVEEFGVEAAAPAPPADTAKLARALTVVPEAAADFGLADAVAAIAATDDMLAMYMSGTRKDLEDAFRTIERHIAMHSHELDELFAEQKGHADALEGRLAGRKRLSDGELKAFRHDRKAAPEVQKLSIEYGLLDEKIQRREAIIKRKTELLHKLRALAATRGIMRDELDTANYNAIKSRKGNASEDVKLARRWYGIETGAAAEPTPAIEEVTTAAAAFASGGAAVFPKGAAATRSGNPLK